MGKTNKTIKFLLTRSSRSVTSSNVACTGHIGFLLTRSSRSVTPLNGNSLLYNFSFLLTRSSRSVTLLSESETQPFIISTHTLLAERDQAHSRSSRIRSISTHTLLAERDVEADSSIPERLGIFLLTRSSRSVTSLPAGSPAPELISTHTLLAERDRYILCK